VASDARALLYIGETPEFDDFIIELQGIFATG
jgi:hypothetical protein